MAYVPERGWLDTLVTSSTAGAIQNLDYSRDALGRITGVTSPIAGESWVYGYDDLDRLTSADNATDNTLDQTFSYDLVGNMLTNSQVGTYSYPAPGSPRPHAVTGISGGPLGSQSFTYDANGSMTVQGPDTRSYDGENRLVSATDGALTTTFVYGPDGARLKKTAGGATTLYFGDDVEVIPGATPQYTKYLPGDAKRVGLSTTTWLHRDHCAPCAPSPTPPARFSTAPTTAPSANTSASPPPSSRKATSANATTTKPASCTSTPATTTRCWRGSYRRIQWVPQRRAWA
jgi:YD repeat-containing protein